MWRKHAWNLSLEEKKAFLHGLAFGCPKGIALDSCAVAALRDLAPEERMTVVSGLTDQQVETLIERHQACLKARDAAE